MDMDYTISKLHIGSQDMQQYIWSLYSLNGYLIRLGLLMH